MQVINTELKDDLTDNSQQVTSVEVNSTEEKSITVPDSLDDVHVTNDIDPEANEMRAINPNTMTNNMEDMSASMMDVDNQMDSDNEDDLVNDDDLIQETVADDDLHHLDDDGLTGTLVPLTQQPASQHSLRPFSCPVSTESFVRFVKILDWSKLKQTADDILKCI